MKKSILILCIAVGMVAAFLVQSRQVMEKTSEILTKKDVALSPLSLGRIFQDDHSWAATLSAERIRTITVTGDIIPARTVNYEVVKRGNPLWPYERVVEKFESFNSDLVFVNLETPLTQDCVPTVEGMSFCGSSSNIQGLVAIGTDIANLANNHSSNREQAGLDETMELLKKEGIEYTGVNNVVIKDLNGIKFAFLGYNDIPPLYEGLSVAREETMKKDIAQAREKADVVIVQFHFGTEYLAQPDDRQKYLARFVVDNGADLVIGNHPHWIQPVEIYKGKLITYAHGNFIFDQMWSQKTREGVIGVYTFFDEELIDVMYHPLQAFDYGQARFLEGEDAKKVMDDMKLQSEILAR